MKEKQKRKFKIVHIILGIMVALVLISLYVFVIVPMNDYRILSSKVIKDTNEYFAALSEQDYERAADYIRIYERTADQTIIAFIDGERDEWIDRMEQLERSGITIQGVRNIRANTKDGCMRNVHFEVMIDANGTPLVFSESANPLALLPSGNIMKCPSAHNYELLDIIYDKYRGTIESRPEEIEQANLAISSELVREKSLFTPTP